jgi:Rrf2 family iron-sulfur cluster assembly transcriptional regulator
MRITQEGDYALRVILYFYNCGVGKRLEAKNISVHENIPPRFLLKLLRKLTVAGIIKSYMGYGGGYAVELPPEKLNVRMVIEAIDGPININKCLKDDELCNAGRAATCVIHRALREFQNNFLSELESLTFAKLLKDQEGNKVL